MASIAILPTPGRARASAAAANPRNSGTCGIFDVAGRLGQAHRDPAWICRTLNAMVTGAGFPAPFPILHRGALSTGVHSDSRWSRAAVDAWFDGQLPPAARGLIDTADRAAVDSRLAVAAATLFADDAA